MFNMIGEISRINFYCNEYLNIMKTMKKIFLLFLRVISFIAFHFIYSFIAFHFISFIHLLHFICHMSHNRSGAFF